jgi:SET domain-containing protein
MKESRTNKTSKALPHYKVYVRLKPSKIHGVGVFAICAIPKGTSIFPNDSAPIMWMKKDRIKNFRGEKRRLYEDFCIIKDNGKTYGCPANFSLMTIAWFLNEPKRGQKPNVGCRNDYTFYALHDIATGEELTVDYSTFSEQID